MIKLVSILSALLVWIPIARSSEGRSRPNIVIIYADDLGYGDVQCYNPERGKIATPHIDRLAKEGIRFTDAHSSSAVCSPSRYTLLTGRYHWRTRLQRGIVGLWGEPVIPSSRLTVASLAQRAGYHTACVGKWHLGWDWPIPDPLMPYFETGGYGGKKDIEATPEHRNAWREVFEQPIPGGPTAVGFAEYFGVDVPNWPPYCFIEGDRLLGIPTEFAAASLFAKNQASVQGPALSGWRLEPILPALGNRAVSIIRRQAKDESPFLLYLSLTSPHTPLSVNQEWVGKSGLNRYADFVMETDGIVGQVLGAIDEEGVSKETLVLFTSDNGCAHYIGTSELETKGHYPSGPLRGYKSDVWEGGHRVPFLVRWPGVVEAGSEFNGLVHQADLFATVAEILEAEVPNDAGEDSFSILATLRGGRGTVRSQSVSCSIRGLPSLRMGRWKWIPGQGSGGWTQGGGDQTQQLYDLSIDLRESNNMAQTESKRIVEMVAVFEDLIIQGRSTPGPKQANDVPVVRYPLAK